MILEHIGLSQINGSLVVLDGVKGVQYDEMAELHLDDGSTRVGRVVRVDGDRCVIQVFEGTRGLSLVNNRTVLTGHPMMMDLSPELLGRVLDGLGRPIDGLGDIYPVARRDVNGAPINPVSRVYPRNYIHTGISSIDCLATLIRGQKLPIFSGSGMKHNELAVQIVRQASVADGSDFAIVFAAMGVKNDVASYFRESFESCGAMERVVMLLNLANDPIIERIITPRAALTVADGIMTATIVWSSPNYDYMLVDGEKYLPVNTDGNSTFEIPVAALDAALAVTADTVAMSTPHEIDYTLTFDGATLAAAE